MGNTFLELLKGDFAGDELVVSLKSTVPVFITYPEIIIPFKSKLTEIIPYYNEKEDYEDLNRNIILPHINSPAQLIILFTKVFEMIVKLFNTGGSQLTYMPKVSLKVDIGGNTAQFKTIVPPEEQVLKFDDAKSTMFTLTGFTAAANSSSLSYEQKHNLLLVDILTREYNNSGLGGRR